MAFPVIRAGDNTTAFPFLASTVTVTVPAGTVGDLLIVTVALDSGNIANQSAFPSEGGSTAGWTKIGHSDRGVNAPKVTSWWRIREDGNAHTYSVTTTGANWATVISYQIWRTGTFDPVNPVSVPAMNNGSNSTPYPSSGIVLEGDPYATLNGSSRQIAVFSTANGATPDVPNWVNRPTGWLQLVNKESTGNYNSQYMCTVLQDRNSTPRTVPGYNFNMTNSAARTWAGMTFFIRPFPEPRSATLGAIKDGSTPKTLSGNKSAALGVAAERSLVKWLTRGAKERSLSRVNEKSVPVGVTRGSKTRRIGAVVGSSKVSRMQRAKSRTLGRITERSDAKRLSFARVKLIGAVRERENPTRLAFAKSRRLVSVAQKQSVFSLRSLSAINTLLSSIMERARSAGLIGTKSFKLPDANGGSGTRSLGRSKTTTLNRITESSSAGVGLRRSKSFRLRVVRESSTVTPVGTKKTRKLGSVAERTTVAGVDASKTRPIRHVREATTGIPAPLGRSKSFTLGRITEGTTSFRLKVSKSKELRMVRSATPITSLGSAKSRTLGGADQGQRTDNLDGSKSRMLGRVVETSTVDRLGAGKTTKLGAVRTAETTTGDLVSTRNFTLGRITSESRSTGLTGTRTWTLRPIGTKTRVDELDASKAATIGTARERSRSDGIDNLRSFTLGRITEGSTPAGPFVTDRHTTLNRIEEGQTTTRPRYRFLSGRRSNKAYHLPGRQLHAWNELKSNGNRAYSNFKRR